MQRGSWGSMATGFGSCRGRCGRHWHEIGSLWGREGDGGMDRSRCDMRRLKLSSFPWELTRGHIPESFKVNFIGLGTWNGLILRTRVCLSYWRALHRWEAAGCCHWNSWGEETLDAYWLTWIVALGLSLYRFIHFPHRSLQVIWVSVLFVPGGPWLPMSFWIEFYAMQSSASLGLHCDWKRLGRCRMSLI